jgi:CubicO group peptidase (beta-lactamase class C family)
MKTQIVLVITIVLLALVAGYSDPVAVQAQETNWPTEAWQTSTPEAQGIDSAKLAEALLTIRQQQIDIHSLMVVRNGSVVVDAYFYPYDGTTIHEVASVSKSVMTTLIGIAADQGRLSLDDPMLSFFSDRTIANRDPWKASITVEHLASMSSGLDCTSERDEATLQEMRGGDDWVQFALDRPVMWEPGTHFVYCSPAIHLLSPILQQATGMTALDFARQYLFEPLGIRDVMWLTDPQGYNRGSEGIYLHPHDMAKFGYLWLNNGVWDGEQIVSREWVDDSVKPQMQVGENAFYGYGWWGSTDDPQAYNADGRGGQHIAVVPAWNLIVVTTGGGFAWDGIVPLLLDVLGDMSETRSANPDGVAELEAAVTAVAQSPAPVAVAPLPETARLISGQTFVFDPNPTTIDSLSLEFNDSGEATFHFTAGGNEMVSGPVALDGVYHLFPGNYNLPMGLRGYWADDQTFVLEYDQIANNDHGTLRMRFEGDHVILQSQETAHETGVTVEGSLQNP